MNVYKIEYRIRTLAENAVNMESEKPNFEIEGLRLEHWEFNHRDGWLADAWLAIAEIKASNYRDAHKFFMEKLVKVVSRIAFVSQCYTEEFGQPFLITKEGSEIGFFGDFHDTEYVGLMFLNEQKSALDKLLNSDVSDAFYYYWNDAVNTVGYAPKLLVMFSAIEALARKNNGKKDWKLIENILGADLKEEIFKRTTGLRHRLTHGEYFNPQDSRDKNYVSIIHKKVMKYFNDQIFKEKLLAENVIDPQRHLFGNTEYSFLFIKPVDKTFKMNLKNVITEAETLVNGRSLRYTVLDSADATGF